MSWTARVPPEQARDPLQSLYARIAEYSSSHNVSHLWQSLGLDPPGLAAAHELYRSLMADPTPLSSAQAELIALVVSATNGCGYCVAHHGPRAQQALGDETLARAVALDYREANLKAQDRVLLDYAVALTCEPAERKQEDVDRVREYGFDDASIVKATEIAAYYNFVNRLVSALGVELEPGKEAWPFGAQR
jgi:uncharacterized peroxidase-related enzyme